MWQKIEKGTTIEVGRVVALCQIVKGYPVWVTKGHMTRGGHWSITATARMDLNNTTPTHFAYLPETNYVIGKKPPNGI